VSTTIYFPRELGVDTASVGGLVGDVVGDPDSALDTRDGDTSYVTVSYLFTVPRPRYMPFVWERVSGPVPTITADTTVVVDVESRVDPTATLDSAGVSIGTSVEGVGLTVVSPWVVDRDDGWTLFEGLPMSLSALPNMIDGEPFNLQSMTAAIGATMISRTTYLRAVVTSGTPHLRQKNRDSIRARNRASRQRGIRAKGYY
jgi:hypothetical protein